MHKPFPSWIADAPMPEAAEFVKRANTAFADPERRLLPICTKAAAFHSAIQIFAEPDDFDLATLDRVKEACAFYEIESDVLPYAELFLNEFDKSAALNEPVEGRFALNDELNGTPLRLFPINDAFDVVDSANELAKMAGEHRIPLVTFVPTARTIIKAAAEHGVNQKLPSLVMRFGVERFPDADEAAKKIAGRELLCKDASIHAMLQRDYIAAIAEVEADPEEAMLKIATIDQVAEISTSFSNPFVPTAYDIVYGGPLVSEVEKAAKEHISVRDVLVPLQALEQVPTLELQYRLSKSAGEQLKGLAGVKDAREFSVVIDKWTERDQKTLLRLMADNAA
jgi:hypothetical protein